MSDNTFLFHDYETFGIHPGKDRPCQFAAIRTDWDLNPIGKPIEWFCQPPNDYVPHPQACLITGITPQLAQKKGLVESDFIARINQEFSVPGTCGVGYNSIRFDDEVTRYTLFRNFLDPYEREWKNGNSRWDLIDMVRACYALRPEGIEWPTNDDGLVSFRLELLTAANGLSHANAHDAVSDVYATIAMAKLIKDKQPKLFSYLLNLRNKKAVAQQFDLLNNKPLVHISGMFGAAQGCASWVLPVAWHPVNKNAMIVVDLNKDASVLLELSAEQIHQRLYTSHANLADGELPIPVKLIHTNKCPVLAPASTLTPERAEDLGLNRSQCRQSLDLMVQNKPQIEAKLNQVFAIEREFAEDDNPDTSLYKGFVGNADKNLMQVLRSSDPQLITKQQFQFSDPRLNRLILRFKGRNYPEYLSENELQQWQAHRQATLAEQIAVVYPELEMLMNEYQNDTNKINVLKSLYNYIENL
ncbi:exodeoxyribonuclease I [Agarivorans sp. 1_MG-2023]|uniref:exodeoxyribonuclease I n=1 Tax=Agarivorans sp. 1_MG-2023 TaxID=3062634 RepID=UPI0026E3D290|nr:exodeoxyribonuclease I [Agarivorans sp. 1_MG-2023]MDO6762089.1 exodeoxyribonuclease I [Agarivorans sp. 1_MG-2023]